MSRRGDEIEGTGDRGDAHAAYKRSRWRESLSPDTPVEDEAPVLKLRRTSVSESTDVELDGKRRRSVGPGSAALVKGNHSYVNDSTDEADEEASGNENVLSTYYPALEGCRSVDTYECLNRIEEGTYGVVYRARDRETGEIVALKKLKMEREREGFPITSLREINTLLKGKHENIVNVKEIVVGSSMDKIYIVMEFVEHDLKSLMESMKQPFSQGETKTLMLQLLRAVAHLHDNWILHRDLKTSNLLMSHTGILKLADFGLAREYGSPLRPYTPLVVTLWYRAPELLLGCKEYSTAVDMWSIGCIFFEFLTQEPLFQGRSEIDQLTKIFKILGTPNDTIWEGFSELPNAQKVTFKEQPFNKIREKCPLHVTKNCLDLLNGLLTYDPRKRLTGEEALSHPYFSEHPLPVHPSMFPTWPAKSELVQRRHVVSPSAPEGGEEVFQPDEAFRRTNMEAKALNIQTYGTNL